MMETIQPYIDKKLISMQRHPDRPEIVIFNYTAKCQYDRAWDDITMMCRGLIYNTDTEEIIARPFKKFFNLEEHTGPLPEEAPCVWEKYDGSLGILYWIDDTPYIATRGSFTSDQAKWATEWFRAKYSNNPEDFHDELTYLFEIIYPENRIVVDYDYEGLVLLGAHDEDWNFVPPHHLKLAFYRMEAKLAHKFLSFEPKALKQLNTENKEGFVLWYPKSKLRLKIKFEEYVRLHRIVTQVTAKSIWEILKEDESFDDILERVPDEFYQWVKDKRNELMDKRDIIWSKSEEVCHKVEGWDRKKSAQYIMKKHKEISGVIFLMLDNKNPSKLIWKLIKPKHETPFRKEV